MVCFSLFFLSFFFCFDKYSKNVQTFCLRSMLFDVTSKCIPRWRWNAKSYIELYDCTNRFFSFVHRCADAMDRFEIVDFLTRFQVSQVHQFQINTRSTMSFRIVIICEWLDKKRISQVTIGLLTNGKEVVDCELWIIPGLKLCWENANHSRFNDTTIESIWLWKLFEKFVNRFLLK